MLPRLARYKSVTVPPIAPVPLASCLTTLLDSYKALQTPTPARAVAHSPASCPKVLSCMLFCHDSFLQCLCAGLDAKQPVQEMCTAFLLLNLGDVDLSRKVSRLGFVSLKS